MRFSLLLLAILTDITMCSLFFSLEEQESLLLWDSLVENIWVGVYSALFSIPPILLVALAFRVPSKPRLALVSASSPGAIRQIYHTNTHRLRCHQAMGFILFILLSSFLCKALQEHENTLIPEFQEYQ